jgi:hypothetical protein
MSYYLTYFLILQLKNVIIHLQKLKRVYHKKYTLNSTITISIVTSQYIQE